MLLIPCSGQSMNIYLNKPLNHWEVLTLVYIQTNNQQDNFNSKLR